MIAFEIFGFPVYRYGIMYFVSFLAGWQFLEYVTSHKLIHKINPTIQKILEGNVDNLLVHIMIGGILGGRLGEVIIYESGYYINHLTQILNFRRGGMSFLGGIIGAVIALGIFFYSEQKKYKKTLNISDYLTLTDLLVVITPLGIALGRVGNRLNRELYGPVIQKSNNRYIILNKLNLLYDYGTSQFFQNELRLNTNFLASFGEGALILVVLQIFFWSKRTKGKMKTGILSGIFLILYSIARFVIEFFRIDSLDDYVRGLTSTQWISIVLVAIGASIIVLSSQKTTKQ